MIPRGSQDSSDYQFLFQGVKENSLSFKALFFLFVLNSKWYFSGLAFSNFLIISV